MRRAAGLAAGLLSLALGGGEALGASSDDPRFSGERVASGLVLPTDVAIAPDGSFFVAEKRGTVLRFAGPLDPTPAVVADLRVETHAHRDRGLLSIALHPAFPAEPWLYVAYTYNAPPGETAPFWGDGKDDADPCPDPPGSLAAGCVVRGRLSRLELDGDRSVEEQVLVDDRWCNQFPSHSMAGLSFGPDGALYVAAGEGASYLTADWGQLGQEYWQGPACDDPENEGGALRAQDARSGADPTSWDGSIVRLDPATGLPLPDNPLAGNAWPGDDGIIAFGLRNPFRLAFDPMDGALWVADVGWTTFEELDRVPDPTDGIVENFGWPCREGPEAVAEYSTVPLCQSFPVGDVGVATDPTWAWDRRVADPDGCGVVGTPRALSGTAFATASSYPADARTLFVGEVISGCIWALPRDTSGRPDPPSRRVILRAPGVVALRTGPEGEIWWVEHGAGEVHRLVALPIFVDGFESGDLFAWTSPAP